MSDGTVEITLEAEVGTEMRYEELGETYYITVEGYLHDRKYVNVDVSPNTNNKRGKALSVTGERDSGQVYLIQYETVTPIEVVEEAIALAKRVNQEGN